MGYRWAWASAAASWESDHLYRTGVVVRGLHCEGFTGERVRRTLENVRAKESSIKLLETPEDFVSLLAPSPDIPVNPPGEEVRGYHNPVGGWANASAAVNKLYEWLRELGGELVPTADMSELLYTTDGRDVRGVKCADGREFTADKVIIALGSWTASHPALRGLMPQGLIVATGQTVAAIQLSPEDAKRYAKIPVSMHHDGSGYYSFPVSGSGST